MTTVNLLIRARMDEVTTVGQFVIDAYTRDFDFFKAYKPSKYVEEFLTNLTAKKVVVDRIVNPVVLTGELKVITQRLLQEMLSLREPMNLLEGYVADASPLTVAPKDFGISPVRKKVNSGDAEGLNGTLNTLVANTGNNLPALKAVGYSDAAFAALKDVQKSIFDDNAAQNAKEVARAALVVNNIGVINDFLKDIKAIWDDGKRLFKLNDKVKVKDYTNADIIRRIRQDELHTKIAGTVKGKGNILASKVKVKALTSVEHKRGKSTTTNQDGYYEIKGLKPTSYFIMFTMPDGKTYLEKADAKTNETVRLDFMEPEGE
jgi:hypothetical protein